MKKIAAALLLSATISAPVFAASQGGYVSIESGIVGLDKARSQLSISTTTFLENPSITFGGGYRFNQIVGIEAGYLYAGDSTIKHDFGTHTITEDLKASALQLALVGSFPISSKFDAVAKLGAANVKLDYSASINNGYSFDPGFVTSASVSKTNLMLALGGLYNITPHFGIRFQYQDFGKVKLDVVSAQDISMTAFTVGMLYSF
ncbi:MAG: outer membrane beta-barrel protein [Sideroxyarcus sp.]